MLRHLSIKDFAVVRATELEFGPGMTVVSGETGAGKSLMVDALGFLSGLRADSGVVRHGADRAELSAEFQLPAEHPGLTWLADNELDDDAQCQLRRIIRADGGSRAWINGRPVTSSQLSDLAARLVEIHGQHEHQALMARNSQLALLDAYARNSAQREQVRQASQRWQALLDERDALSAQGDVSDRIGFLEHQLAELEREDLDPAAIAALDTNHRRQAHATALIGACESVVQQLNGDEGPSALGLLQDSRHDLARVAEHEPRLGEVDALLDSAAIQIEEALALLDRVRDDLDADPTQFEAMERRLGRLHDLARKHRVAPDELAAHRDHLTAEVESLRGADERLQQLDKHIAAAIGVWQGAASVLSASRQSAAQALSAATTTLIGELGMGGGQFLIQLQTQETLRPDPNGAERVEFLVAANAGQPPRALRKVFRRRTVAYLAGDRSGGARPGQRADHGVRRSGFRYRRRGGRHRRPEAACPGRRTPGTVRHPLATGRRQGPRALPREQGAGGWHDPERGGTARPAGTPGRTGAHARRRGSQQGSPRGGAQAAAERLSYRAGPACCWLAARCARPSSQ